MHLTALNCSEFSNMNKYLNDSVIKNNLHSKFLSIEGVNEIALVEFIQISITDTRVSELTNYKIPFPRLFTLNDGNNKVRRQKLL